MTIKTFFKTCLVTAVLGSFVLAGTSCQKDETPAGEGNGTITGTVTNADGDPIDGVSVSASNSESTATTGADGTYTLSNVPVATLSVTFEKEGYQTNSITVPASRFSNGTATVNATLTVAGAKITGTVLDGANENAPLEGATVTLNNGTSATTGSDGTFTIENLTVRDYTLSVSAEGYIESNTAVAEADFNNEETTATVTVTLYKTVLLPGLTLSDLQNADIWYYNEYKGGRNAGASDKGGYPMFDWTSDYMATLDFRGAWAEQNEGTAIQIQNNEDQRNNPANHDSFDSFVFGRKEITEDNKIMTLWVRNFAENDEDVTTEYGVTVIDLTATEPTAVKIGDNKTLNSDSYLCEQFDLSEYIGKEIVIAIGTYRAETGDYFRQLCIRRIAFASEAVTGEYDWLPGTEVSGLAGWHMTEGMVRSTIANNTYTTFTGVSKVSGNRDEYATAYKSWRGQGHIAAEWSLVPVAKDSEPFPTEGYVIKTRGNVSPNLTTPESYFYIKYAIEAGKNKMTLKARSFSEANSTWFRLTVIDEDMTVTHILPASHKADSYSEEDENFVKFNHRNGTADAPDGYATFTYDLSAFDGKEVILALGVYVGEQNGDENKLCINEITFN